MLFRKSFHFTLVLIGCQVLASSRGSRLEESCMKVGINKHPHDLHKYLICFQDDNGRYWADDYSCSPGHIFSEKEHTCILSDEMGDHLKYQIEGSCNEKMISCIDFSHYILCDYQDGAWVEVSNGSCKSLGMECCGGLESTCTNDTLLCQNFTCTRNGFFPDPDDCDVFYECKNGISAVGKCPWDQVYSPCDMTCTPRTSPGDCKTLRCEDSTSFPAFLTYPDCFEYYIVCLNAETYFVFKCDDGFVFDGKKCIPS
ncbi:uncharacterized protein LOC124171742 [Ischnura elegans]|uniref:uncharacterized protein LOC124171742 n=1 Tax=Ischnura elegans TaxID=197161 RepID=UPI001ED89502|nr:uncharacterized protein LOC124171742 [Ischnura elegans]